MILDIYKSIDFVILEARKQDSGVGNQKVFSLIYSTKRDIRDWKSFKANVYFISPALFSYIKIINGCKLRPLSC